MTENIAPKKEKKNLPSIGRIIVYILLSLWALIVLFPFYWMILTSFKSYGAYNGEHIPKLFTLSPTIENYSTAFESVPLLDYFVNTLIFTLATTAIMLVVIIPAAFAFARLNFRGKNLLFTMFLALMMIPGELVVITNFVTVTNLGLRNSFPGLILPSVTSVFYIYLLKENFSQIPDELYLAAKVDGTTDLKYMFKVMLPMCKPTVITVTILKIIECWNSYVWPRLITDDPAYFLVSNGIQEIRENGFGRENIPAMMASVVVISVPLIILFLIFRKKIMEGVARGGTKG
ncbi:MAG: carbohydrate ABC transporter permease [Clostridia bacterium]|nr:carbohydrate ABC transporter permease [Clostridia bacterium]